jgi:hypothetical protein
VLRQEIGCVQDADGRELLPAVSSHWQAKIAPATVPGGARRAVTSRGIPMIRSLPLSILTAAVLPFTAGAALAQSDHINAAIIVKELKAMGYASNVDTDDSGDPRVNTKIDGYNWSIYFYDCASGPRDDRLCNSYQFYSGYTTPKPVPLTVINKWNTEQRYAKAYTAVLKSGASSARIEIDVRMAGTGADPSRTFRLHFNIMKDKAERFRKVIAP